MLKYTHASKRSTQGACLFSKPSSLGAGGSGSRPWGVPPYMGLLVVTACPLGSQAAKGFNTVVGPLGPWV